MPVARDRGTCSGSQLVFERTITVQINKKKTKTVRQICTTNYPGTGEVTVLAADGSNPAWSPNP